MDKLSDYLRIYDNILLDECPGKEILSSYESFSSRKDWNDEHGIWSPESYIDNWSLYRTKLSDYGVQNIKFKSLYFKFSDRIEPLSSKNVTREKSRRRKGMNTAALSMVTSNVTTSLTNGFKSKANMLTDYALQILKSRLKDHFGKEYYLSNSTTDTFKNKKLLKFVEKFDPNYDLHYFKHAEALGSFVSICPVRNDTYIYIATKKYVPDTITNAILYSGNNNSDVKYDMYIYIFGKKSKALCNVLDRILEDRKSCTKGNRIYNIYEVSTEHGNSITTIDLKYREMKNMYYSFNELEIIKNHINTFMKNKEVYDAKQIMYKTGILLYGEPGTGKSTLAKAIATEYHRSIVTIDMANVFKIDFTGLTSMINCDIYDEYIILLEDIDTLFLNREENNSTESKNYNDIINKLLQFLDSNTSPNNVIFIATTNHLDRLDSALLRDGRFDLKVEVKGLKEEDIHSMVESFGVDSKYIPEIIDKYNDSISGNKYDYNLYNQSKLQNIIIKYI